MHNESLLFRQASESAKARRNNFNLIRTVGAMMVLIGHMGPIMGREAPTLGGFGLHTVGVSILFLLGGYLVGESWKRDPHVLRYAIRRFFRLFPPFAAAVLVMTFCAGPMLSVLGFQGYFGSWWATYLQNLRFFIIYAQPGVFETSPIPYVTNGSFWTMPVEAALYVLTPLLIGLFGIRRKKQVHLIGFAAFVVAVGAVAAWLEERGDIRWVFYATDWAAALKLSAFWFIGMACAEEKLQRFFRVEYAPFALLAWLIVQNEAAWVRYAVFEVSLSYIVFSLGLAPGAIFAAFGQKHDLSYGIYLYGFFFQQLVVLWQSQRGWDLGFLGTLAVSAVLTTGAAYLSCIWVERPVMRLCRRIVAATRRNTHD